MEHYDFLKLKDFQHLMPDQLKSTCDQAVLSNRIKTEATYRNYEQIENERIDFMRKEEELRLPDTINYAHSKLNLSNEAIDALNKSRPSNVRLRPASLRNVQK